MVKASAVLVSGLFLGIGADLQQLRGLRRRSAIPDYHTSIHHRAHDYGPESDLVNRENVPLETIDLLECFSQVVAANAVPDSDVLGRSTLDYFLFMASNLAVARGGEAIPYDHDLDVAIDPGQHAAFSALWMSSPKLRAHQARFEACQRAEVEAELVCGEGNGTYFFNCDPHSDSARCQKNELRDCKIMRLYSNKNFQEAVLDVWEVAVPDPSNNSQACQWGFCMEMKDVLPTKACSFISTPLGRQVATRCLQEPRSWAAFYSTPQQQKNYESATWKRPRFNFWNGASWEWCEGAWQNHQHKGGDLYVHGSKSNDCASFSHHRKVVRRSSAVYDEPSRWLVAFQAEKGKRRSQLSQRFGKS